MKYTRDMVLKILSRYYSQNDINRIMKILDEYGSESWQPAKERVQLAIIKLSQGDEYKLRKNVEHAKIDCDDILWPAEEPNLTAALDLASLTQEEIQRLQDVDRKQYLDWLNE